MWWLLPAAKKKREKHTRIQWKRNVSLESKIIFKITKWKYWTEKYRIWNKKKIPSITDNGEKSVNFKTD